MDNWLTGLVIAVLLFGWAISGLQALNLNPKTRWSRSRFAHPDVILISLAFLLGAVGAIGIFVRNFSWIGFLQTIAPELLSISVTILILDRLYEYRGAEREKSQIITQMASQSNDIQQFSV